MPTAALLASSAGIAEAEPDADFFLLFVLCCVEPWLGGLDEAEEDLMAFFFLAIAFPLSSDL